MSDFDKEAERERLREKYEREQEKRKSTEQMSELLLKGATMTNAHCNDCGDPIFRYDGEEFCPTCQQPVASAGEAAADEVDEAGAAEEAGGADAAEDGSDTHTDDGDTSATGSTSAGTDSAKADAGTVADGRSAQVDANGSDIRSADAGSDTPAEAGEVTSAQGGSETSTQRRSDRPESTRSPEPAAAPDTAPAPDPASSPQPSAPSGDVADELGAARESLTRTLLTQAREAERCDDPRRAKDHLAAAREAAEALSALSAY